MREITKRILVAAIGGAIIFLAATNIVKLTISDFSFGIFYFIVGTFLIFKARFW